MPIKVMIIDDSALVRETLTKVLNSDQEIKVIATASDPIFGVKKIKIERPDVIVLDIEMARMDGLTFLKKMNGTIDPIPCVICSAIVEENSDAALKAMEYGACSIIKKPALGTRKFLEEAKMQICDAVKEAFQSKDKIRALRPSPIAAKTVTQTTQKSAGAVLPKQNAQPSSEGTASQSSKITPPKMRVPQPKLSADVMLEKPTKWSAPLEVTEKIVVVGASTGGTEALKDFLVMLPPDSPGIVIVQHMPEHFTAAFANRLDGLCKIHVKEAHDGDEIIKGQALIAPGNYHTMIKRSAGHYFVEVRDGPLVSRHRPSVDVLFRSAARYAGKNAIGIIMTGMGDDGAKGMLDMHETGAFNIAQDEKTCIVYGMPCEAVKAGAVDKIVPLQSIAQTMLNACSLHKK